MVFSPLFLRVDDSLFLLEDAVLCSLDLGLTSILLTRMKNLCCKSLERERERERERDAFILHISLLSSKYVCINMHARAHHAHVHVHAQCHACTS